MSFIYIPTPGHTEPHYQGTEKEKSEYRDDFINHFSPNAELSMREIMEVILIHDPAALVLFFGDHGVGVSQGLYDPESVKEEEKRPYMVDFHAVLAGIYPADACAPQMEFATKYITTAMLARAIVVCLADGKDPINWEVDYGSPYADIRFEDYLYE